MTSNLVVTEEKKRKAGIATRYHAFYKRQENQGMLWFLISLISLPAVVMPISILAMSYLSGFVTFIGISMLMFFTNIILTIAEQPTKTKITFYLITVLFHLVVPLVVFLFGLFL